MAVPKGLLVVPIGFNPSGDVRAITLSADDYLNCVLEAGLTGGGVGEPKGNLVTICGFDPDGKLRAIELDANDNVLMTLLGGSANQIVKSDGTDAEWSTLADVIEAAILTVDGDIMIREGGVVKRLAKPAIGQILGESGQIPAWIAKPSGAYTEGSRVYNDANISIANTTWTLITFNQENYDTDVIHSTTVNPGRLICKTAGKYDIKAHCAWAHNAAGHRLCRIYLNGTTTLATGPASAPVALGCTSFVFTNYEFAVNDFIEFHVYQNSGGALNVITAGVESPAFMMQRIG